MYDKLKELIDAVGSYNDTDVALFGKKEYIDYIESVHLFDGIKKCVLPDECIEKIDGSDKLLILPIDSCKPFKFIWGDSDE